MEVGDASELLSNAWKAIEDSDLPKTHEIQAAALPSAIALLSGGAAGRAQGAGTEAERHEPSGGLLDRLASRLQLPRDVLEEVWMESSDGLEIALHPNRLASSKSAGARQVALLVVAQRQAAGEEDTPIDEVRKVATDFGRYDAPNFSSAVGELRGAFLFKGQARQRTLRMTRTGWAQASDLVRELTGRGYDR